jgi:hypothetical protein
LKMEGIHPIVSFILSGNPMEIISFCKNPTKRSRVSGFTNGSLLTNKIPFIFAGWKGKNNNPADT